MHKIIPKIINIGRIINFGKCFLIATMFFLIHQGIKYKQHGTIPPASHRLISSTAPTFNHTVSHFEPKSAKNYYVVHIYC